MKLLNNKNNPETGLGNNWISLGIAVICVAVVTYAHAQQSDDDFLVDDGQQSTQADDYKKARSIKAQMLDNLTDEELALYCALTGQTAAQLDKEESEFKKALLANPEVFEEHLEDFLKKQSDPKNEQELWSRIYAGSEIAKKRLMRGALTMRQQEEQGRNGILADNQKYHQSVTDSIAKRKVSVKSWGALEKKRPKNEDYKYGKMESELRLAQQQAVLEAYRPLWVHLGILPEDEVHKKDETLNNGALLKMWMDASNNADRRQQAIWDGQSQEFKTWKAGQEMIEVRVATLTEEELDRWTDMELWSLTEAGRIAMDDAKFASWRASVNEDASPPAQNPGDLLPDDTTPASVTNADDNEETSPTPAPSPGSEEETNSGSLGDDASPGSPTVPGGLE